MISSSATASLDRIEKARKNNNFNGLLVSSDLSYFNVKYNLGLRPYPLMKKGLQKLSKRRMCCRDNKKIHRMISPIVMKSDILF